MFSMARILLPVDFSKQAVGAARYAEAFAEKYGSEVTMLHVMPPPHYEIAAMDVGSPALAEIYMHRKGYAEKQCQEFLRAELPQLKARRLMVEGDPASEIVKLAHDDKMNLIVMPTHGYGLFRRFILGSVAAKVLHDADCPVMTGAHLEDAPPVEEIRFPAVLAALDYGPATERTLDWAARFAEAHGAKLVVMHAIPSLEGRTGEYFDPDWRLYLAKQAREEMEKLLEKTGVKAEITIEAGDPAHMAASVARGCGAGLVVIGRGSQAGIFGRLRANAYAIIRESPVPVVSV